MDTGHDRDYRSHNCPHCHEVTPCPAGHTCGRTPQGTVPAHQPHTRPVARSPVVSPPTDLVTAFRAWWTALVERGPDERKRSDYTLAGPEKA